MDDDQSGLSLGELLQEAADGLDGVATGADDRGTTWSIGSVPFAALNGETAEFRLDPQVTRAALRTPDTAPSSRGPEWVAFRPPVLDDGATDRAEAWFLSAARRATGSPPSGERRRTR
jgi:hypothetical protein